MIAFQIIAVVLILGFIGWLFFVNKKTVKKTRYTEKKTKKTLTDFDKMLTNITQKQEIEIIEKPIEEIKPKEKAKRENAKKQTYNSTEEDQKFDLKNAIIGSAILNKNKKNKKL